MSEKIKKAKDICKQALSKRSYEPDPSLKDIALNLDDKSSSLREGKSSNFEQASLSKDEISYFANEIEQIPKLEIDYRESLSKIANTFRKSFTAIQHYREANKQIQEILIEGFFQSARALAVAVEARDPYTGGHSDRVFQIAKALGKMCNVSAEEQLYLEAGALLHDVGKIGIRDGVLLKPGPLTDSEYKEMQLHPIIGAHMVEKFNCLHGCVDAVLLHHERMDGYGYPYGLKGSQIPLIARITSVADAYDAMTTNRIYRKGMDHEHALEEIIRNSDSQFDPEIVKVFVEWWEKNIGGCRSASVSAS